MSANQPPPPSSPPPSGPPPSGPPPSGPPPSGPPGSADSSPRRSKAPWIVGAALLFVVAVVAVLVVTLTGNEDAQDATSVQDVADVALSAAEDLDIDAGIDVLCEAPGAGERAQLEELIDEARDRAGTDDPDVDYEVSDVKGDASGSFAVRVSSDEDGLDDQELEFVVLVESRDGRSCISDIENP